MRSKLLLTIVGALLRLGQSALGDPLAGETGTVPPGRIGDAWSDPRNPVVHRFGGQRLDLWSVHPVCRLDPPQVKQKDWPVNAIDQFVLAKLEAARLAPSPVADKRILIRRLSFDLIGLPPTVDEVNQFIADDSSDAWERLVDRLLASPRYGEHQARMWLDVVRYSDSNGFDWDEFRPQAWRFRDYVIRSFNADKPFDQFVREQLAGDELLDGPPRDAAEQDSLIATGYLRLGPHDNSAPAFNEQARSRAELLADLTETTGSAFLGVTMSCCRCHDHKYDPILQADHYRLRAFFASVKFADDLPIDLRDQQEAIKHYNDALDAKKSKDPHREFTHALLMTDDGGDPPPTKILSGGDYRNEKDPVDPGFLSILDPNPAAIPKGPSPSTHGRRLALANWIASQKNPLTARVLVNRIWQGHFGRGLVATPNDFGLAGASPTHPQLLDYLASEFVRGGWSIKRLHRLIVTSATYRQSSAITPATAPAQQADPRNDLLWRQNLRRLSAEQIRDAMLAGSGLLQQRDGGPPIWPQLPPEVLKSNPAFLDDNAEHTKGWYPSPPQERNCRGVYLVQKRNSRLPFLETFDLPENATSCPRRNISTVAPQALSLMNGDDATAAAKALADRVERETRADNAARIRRAFELAFDRKPEDAEAQACADLLKSHSLAELCRALLNTNEFVYED